MKGNNVRLICCGLVFLLASFICPSRGPLAKEVRLGGVSSLTGKYASYGTAVKIGVQYVIKEVNESGGIKSLGGAKIKLIWADAATSGTKAATEAERLITAENVSAVIGPVTTPTSIAAEPAYLKYKTPAIFCITTYDGLFEHGNPYIRTVSVLASQIGRSYAIQLQYMAKNWQIPIDRISIAYPDNDYGKTVHKYFMDSIEKAGLKENVVAEIPFQYKTTDLSPVVLKLKGVNPTFHIQVAYTADGKLFHDACYALEFHPWMLGGMSGFNHPKLWGMLGEKIGSQTLGNPRTFVGNFYASDTRLPAYRDFLSRFRARNKKTPVEMNLVLGVQAAYLLVEALERAGSVDRQRLNDALAAIRLPLGHPRMLMTTFAPELGFTSQGKPLHARTYVQQWWKENGRWRLYTVWPKDEATRKPKATR
jgi:branched-chain amino acid transport system substrate-binding protein